MAMKLPAAGRSTGHVKVLIHVLTLEECDGATIGPPSIAVNGIPIAPPAIHWPISSKRPFVVVTELAWLA